MAEKPMKQPMRMRSVSGQSQLAFVGIGSGGTRSDFQKVKRSEQQKMVGPQGRWQRDNTKEKGVGEIHLRHLLTLDLQGSKDTPE